MSVLTKRLSAFLGCLGVVVVGCFLALLALGPDKEQVAHRELVGKYNARAQEMRSIAWSWSNSCLENFPRDQQGRDALKACRPRDIESVSWEAWGEPISLSKVREHLVPAFREEVPATDFMGGEYEFRLHDDVLAIRSPGCDLEFQGPDYPEGRFDLDSCEGDEVLVGASKVQWVYAELNDHY